MKNFLKYTLASLFAFLIGSAFLLFIGMGILSAIVSTADKPIKVKANSVLMLTLDKTLTDRALDNPFEYFSPLGLKFETTIGLDEILKNIEKAKTDENIKGIYLNINAISSNFGGYASLEEIRNKLLEFKQTGKFIISYNNFGYMQKSYYLCSVADSIFINPKGMVLIPGLGGEISFYKKFLKKIGVEPQVVRHGKFKGAVEPYMLDKMSEENREQTMKYLGAMWNNILTGISKERNVSIKKLNNLTDELAVRKPKAALKYNLVDGLVYEDEMISKLKKLAGLKEASKLSVIGMKEYSTVTGKSSGYIKDKIAVIYASGEIGLKQTTHTIGPQIANTIRKARKDTTIKAIVLRVNSPGGNALITELIWREIELASQAKPVIASMGNVAASGGYYMACGADTIVADPNTITGSIGIYGLLFSGEELIQKKLGITTDAFGTNKFSTFGGSYPLPFLPFSSRKLTDAERAILQDFIEEGYDTFITRVANGRGMTKEEVDRIGQGRVWNAQDAQKIGLIDVLGGLETAIEMAREKAGLEKYRIIPLPKEKPPLQTLIEEFSGEMKTQILKSELGESYNYYKQTKSLLESSGIQARIPYDIRLH